MKYRVYIKDEDTYHSEYDNIKFMTNGWVEMYNENGRSDYFPKENIKYISEVRSM